MSPHEKHFHRVAGILFAHDPAGVAKYQQPDEYDLYCEDILACKSRDELEASLRKKDLYGLRVFATLKHYLGMSESVDELYPLPGTARVESLSRSLCSSPNPASTSPSPAV